MWPRASHPFSADPACFFPSHRLYLGIGSDAAGSIIISSDQAEETLEERAQFVQHRLLLHRMAIAFVEP